MDLHADSLLEGLSSCALIKPLEALHISHERIFDPVDDRLTFVSRLRLG
jgi:hypothetical protein